MEPILIEIIEEDLIEIQKNALDENHDLLLINLKDYTEDIQKQKIKNISEILYTEERMTYIVFKNISDKIINSKEFLLLYDFSTALNLKLFKIN